MQKDYREFTVGELLDMGLSVEILKHNVDSLEVGKTITRIFEGTKQSTKKHQHFTVVKAWKGKFGATVFVRE